MLARAAECLGMFFRAAVFIKLKVLSGCSEMIREFSFALSFPLLLAGIWLLVMTNLSSLSFIKSSFHSAFISFFPSSFLHSHTREDPASCAKWIYFKTLSAPWKGLSSSIFCFSSLLLVLLSLLFKIYLRKLHLPECFVPFFYVCVSFYTCLNPTAVWHHVDYLPGLNISSSFPFTVSEALTTAAYSYLDQWATSISLKIFVLRA